MKFNIYLNSRNQGVSVHVNGTRDVAVNKITKDGVFPVVEPKKTFSWHTIVNSLKKKKTKGAVALVSTLILAGAITVSFLTRDTLENRLYKSYYEPMKYNFSGYLIKNTSYELAKKKYIEGDPTIALLLLKELSDDFAYKNEKMLYEALAYMDLEDYETAIDYFDKLLPIKENKYFLVIVRWYQGLCFLKTNDMILAKKSFESVSNGDSNYKKRAKHILKRIEKDTR